MGSKWGVRAKRKDGHHVLRIAPSADPPIELAAVVCRSRGRGRSSAEREPPMEGVRGMAAVDERRMGP